MVSNIGFLGAPLNKNGSFWVFKLLKTLPKGWYGIKQSKIVIFLVFDKRNPRGGVHQYWISRMIWFKII